jgi:hypothetical protein
MTFIHEQGDHFLRERACIVTALLLDWHHAVMPECPRPLGLNVAANLVQGLWQIATEGNERFEKYWSDDKWVHTSPSANRLCWLVASVAGALDSRFFRAVGLESLEDRNGHSRTAQLERNGRVLGFGPRGMGSLARSSPGNGKTLLAGLWPTQTMQRHEKWLNWKSPQLWDQRKYARICAAVGITWTVS